MDVSEPFWYPMISPGDRHPLKPSLLGAEGSYRASESVNEVGSSIFFLLGYPGSGVVFAEGGFLMNSRGLYSLLQDSFR